MGSGAPVARVLRGSSRLIACLEIGHDLHAA